MPVKKTGKKFSVNNKEYDTEDEANKAYMSYLDKALGVPEDKPEKKKPKKKVNTNDDEEYGDTAHTE